MTDAFAILAAAGDDYELLDREILSVHSTRASAEAELGRFQKLIGRVQSLRSRRKLQDQIGHLSDEEQYSRLAELASIHGWAPEDAPFVKIVLWNERVVLEIKPTKWHG